MDTKPTCTVTDATIIHKIQYMCTCILTSTCTCNTINFYLRDMAAMCASFYIMLIHLLWKKAYYNKKKDLNM